MEKKKIFFHSDYSKACTGFGKNAKNILTYLYRTGKYELFNYCCGITKNHPEFQRTPWLTEGCLPNDQAELNRIQQADPHLTRDNNYGAYLLDDAISRFKPDVYIGCQDIWAFDYCLNKTWWNKIPCVIHTTLDSLPILPSAVSGATKIKNYWIWSEFATKALHELGHKHSKTIHGALESHNFFKLDGKAKKDLRAKFNIRPNAFIIGFVFRNQLRKSVPNLLEGYALWKSRNPEIKNTMLLLHTHFGEGWNIPRLAEQYKVNLSEILCSYICRTCGNYIVSNFKGQDLNCDACNTAKAMVTTNVMQGVTEEQLNEIYNLMDVYCHPFTSGGQEIPIQEAKLTELITLVTNYSCGEDLCVPEAASLSLEWSKYTEHGTEFIKASTLPSSISKQLDKVYHMTLEDRARWGVKAREWTIKNYGIEAVGKQIEEFLDTCPKTAYNFDFTEEPRNPDAVIPVIKDDSEWLIYMYKNILNMTVDINDDGHKYWMQTLKNGSPRQPIEDYFRQTAIKENEKIKKINFEDLLNKNDKKRVLYVMPRSIGDIFNSTSLFKSIRERYPKPEWTFYVATLPQYFEVLDGNEYLDKIIPYHPNMENLLWLEGQGDHKGYFEVAYLPHIGTQRILNYLHNGMDKLDLELKK